MTRHDLNKTEHSVHECEKARWPMVTLETRLLRDALDYIKRLEDAVKVQAEGGTVKVEEVIA